MTVRGLSTRLWLGLIALMLSACASGPGAAPALQWLGSWVAGEHRQEPLPVIDPRYAYLRAHVDDQPAAYMVLGFVDDDDNGAIETWYSAQRETLRVQRGRVVSAHGVPVGLSGVRWQPHLPDWPEPSGAVSYFRVQDLDGLSYGEREAVDLRASSWSAVPGAVRAALRPSDRTPEPGPQWRWYVEHFSAASASGASTEPAWLAVDAAGEWVFTRQCLRPNYCLNLQVWP